ncbi:serine/threonine-protein phosphatase 6 regulatory ankyrin repeat subunit B-like [Paramacrobiotus metropolitanus]|uniref:serine/threonine-protein phosphatase 6 regulatory ankyrin repeat subunit B-like n=1 Tax=Paramacrobiotus metropolitanus TaxID=2943436 RepID=UPI002445AEFE|nr:serine/threonine-protein phosphatase 6 regulatory ankyrin repeat subunit B-like [Paramacrobiotus metropolitanus]
MTPITACMYKGKIHLIEQLVQLGADINMKDMNNSTAIHYAAATQKEDTVEQIVLIGGDAVTKGGKLDQLPLHIACSRLTAAFPIIRFLKMVSGEESLETVDNEGYIPLFRSVERSSARAVKELLSSNTTAQLTYHNAKMDGDTVLHFALRLGQTDIFRILLEAGAPVNEMNILNQTLLHVAVIMNNVQAITHLHEFHANANLRDKYDRTPLQLAVERGSSTVIDQLITHYPESIHVRTEDGSTLAHIAALYGHAETMVTLLKRGVYPHMPNKSGALALHAAARAGHASVIQSILSTRNAFVDAKTRKNYTALHLAVEFGKVNVVEVLLGAGASPHTKGGTQGETPLHVAAKLPNGVLAAVSLIKSGANVNAKLDNQDTPLHLAARAGGKEMVRILLQEKADSVAKNFNGETPFLLACRSCHYEVAKILIEHLTEHFGKYEANAVVAAANKEGETVMHFVAETNPEMTHFPEEHIKLLHLILDHHANVTNQTRLTFETPLHYCARNGNSQMLAVLLANLDPDAVQAAINRQTKNGWSPLLTASERGDAAIVKTLLRNHARTDIFDETGRTALHIAVENGHLEVVDVLARKKAFINARTRTGATPLHLASMKGYEDIVRLLVEKYAASVDANTNDMKHPLHFAVQYGTVNVCECLLSLNADPLAMDNRGSTSLHLAAEYNKPGIIKLFLSKLADRDPLSLRDARGQTAAIIAAKNGCTAVIEELLSFDKNAVINSLDADGNTVFQLSATGGHTELLQLLMDHGITDTSENTDGLNAFSLAAKNGHLDAMAILYQAFSPQATSIKNGYNALHLAAYWGQTNIMSELLPVVPAGTRSSVPASKTTIGTETGAEAGLTALHLACRAGQDEVVRMLLNYPGAEIDAVAEGSGYCPLHMAAINGHVNVVVLLLTRSGIDLDVKDKKGQTPLMLASLNGRLEMATLLISQGAHLDVSNDDGWTALHCAAVAGKGNIVNLLCAQGANVSAFSKDKKIPLCYAVHSQVHGSVNYDPKERLDIVYQLLKQKYDSYHLLDDNVFLTDLMLCAKPQPGGKPLYDFMRYSLCPVEFALKLANFFRDQSVRDKLNAVDLYQASDFCEQTAGKFLSFACLRFDNSDLLSAVDRHSATLLELIVNFGHKKVVALPAVQAHLGRLWYGGTPLQKWQIVLIFLMFLCFPPLWLIFSIPCKFPFSKTPFLKLVLHITSDLYFIILFVLVFMTPFQPLYERNDLMPLPEEWLLLLWLFGNFVADIVTHHSGRGLETSKVLILVFSLLAIIIHVAAIFVVDGRHVTLLYVRSQLLATACFFADIRLLSYLSFHQLFGPFGVMLGDLMMDAARFLVLLSLFIVGFTFSFSALYESVIPAPAGEHGSGEGHAESLSEEPGVSFHHIEKREAEASHEESKLVPGENINNLLMPDMVLDPLGSLYFMGLNFFLLINRFDHAEPEKWYPKPTRSPAFADYLTWVVNGAYLTAVIIGLSEIAKPRADPFVRQKLTDVVPWSETMDAYEKKGEDFGLSDVDEFQHVDEE